MSKYLELARQVVVKKEHQKTDEDLKHKEASPYRSDQTQPMGHELDAPYQKPDSPIPDCDKSDISDQSPPEETEPWDEDTASRLIEDAFSYLCEQYLKAGKPDFNSAAVHGACARIDKAYGAEDMGGLRRALRAFVAAGIEEFRQRQRAA